MQGNPLPILDRLLPTAVWERFVGPYRAATGLSLILADGEGRVLRGEAAGCPGWGTARCNALYRKVALQARGGTEPLVFRCPEGLLLFGASAAEAAPGFSGAVLVGGPVVAEGAEGSPTPLPGGNPEADRDWVRSLPVSSPRKFQSLAQLAQLSLRWIMQGHHHKYSYTQRQAQILTLFEVAGDLGRATSAHELNALALNTLGVLFEVPTAATLLREPGGDTLRVHTAMGSLEQAVRGWTVGVNDECLAGLTEPGSAVYIDDVHALGKLGLPEEIRSLTAFCLGGRGERFGLLVVFNAAPEPEGEQLMRGFAVQLSLAFENQRLQQEIAARVRELAAVQEMSRQFLASLDPEELFQVILEEARKLTGAQKGSLMLPTGADGGLSVRAVTGMNDGVVEKLRAASDHGIAARVFADGEAIVVANLEKDVRVGRKNRARYATKSFASVPIRVDGRTVGVLNLTDKLSGEIFSEEDLRLLQAMAAQATMAIERSTYYAQSQELRKISITDSLTGLLNRRYFQERLAEEVDRATRHGHALSLIMIDIDHFKAYNDANGHLAGDRALVLVGRALRASIRTIDVVSRFGGEEFAVILPETRKAEAMDIGERVRREVDALYFPGEEAQPERRLTVSLGVAGFPEDARDLKSLIQRADRALYTAKADGRNRIVAYGGLGGAPASPAPPSPWTKVL